jgi:molybdopterin-containing oxidoreductase family iron-sulfur binding subunit
MSESSNQATPKTYWKSLNELAQNKEYQNFVEREFPENATELNDGVSRKGFLRIMGASIALAGFAACRRPVQKILPYAQQPEDIVPGIPLFYASAMPFQGNLVGLVIENHEGRPTKVEGNDLHPGSHGNTNAYHQATMLEMYDPDRSRYPVRNGAKSSSQDFIAFAESFFADTNKRVVFISEANSGLTYNALKADVLAKFPNAQWVTYEAFGEENVAEGNRLAFGRRLRSHFDFSNADVYLSLDDDVLAATHANGVEYAKQLTARRRVTSTQDSMNRIYSVENGFTLTGSYADHRLRVKASEVHAFADALAGALSTRVNGLSAYSEVNNQFTHTPFLVALANDLAEAAGRSAVSIGWDHAPEAHATVAAINAALNNIGETVHYLEVPSLGSENQHEAMAAAVASMNAGEVDAAIIVGANPVLTAPADWGMEEALSKVGEVIHLSTYNDETGKKSNWHLSRAHFLEAWGDGYSFGGARSVIQPQIQPLHDSMSEIELLSLIANGSYTTGYDLVQSTFKGIHRTNFDEKWTSLLHDGVDRASAAPSAEAVKQNGYPNSGQASAAVMSGVIMDYAKANVRLRNVGPQAPEAVDGLELVIRPDASVYDGRFANNGWLQELPDPMTKITWDNVALMSPATAARLGLENEKEITVTAANGASVTLAAWIQPGQADDSITIHAGYGREGIGRVADYDTEQMAGGKNVYPLRTMATSVAGTAQVSATGNEYAVSCVQDHHSLEGRDMYRQASLEKYKETPNYASFAYVHKYDVPGMKEAAELGEDQPISLFNEQTYPDYEPQWGMAIDLNACFGCGVCVIACQSENNIPVIGKKEVGRGREMHWIRNDRYYMGDENDPQAVHQPVPCMHCELAPCEQVCPVAATTHSDDGMNQMTYNRCIGTRYCANNCPFKVRRFNFFNYPKEYLTTGEDPDIIQMAMNPEVTVRFRGVMEKCTYCAQRVNRAKIDAKINTGSVKPADGAVVTACQQACPADAIYFGDLTDEQATVTQMKRNERNYLMLEELNVRPRTSYIAKLTNPNPALVDDTMPEAAH